jgi:hypothetical protein
VLRSTGLHLSTSSAPKLGIRWLKSYRMMAPFGREAE